MQFGPYRHRGPTPRGVEGWLPPLIVALASILLVLALVYFIFVANSMRDRMPLPPATIPASMGAASLLCLYMLFRAIGQFKEAWRIFRQSDSQDV